MLLKRFIPRFFSTFKVPIQSIKKLREETSAPMGECKKALEQSAGNHQQATQWLRNKGLSNADKRSDKQTREGVIASMVSECRKKAILLEINCQTDFVAKNDLFLKFVNGVGEKLLESTTPLNASDVNNPEQVKKEIDSFLESNSASNIFPEDTNIKSLSEQMKIVISRLQQNIRVRRAVILHSQSGRYGRYVHMQHTKSVGLQAGIVQIHADPQPAQPDQIEALNQFADDMACQILGSPPKYMSYEQIPQEQINQEYEKAKQAMEKVLEKAPQDKHETIIAGKMRVQYYSHVLLGSMPYILSNEGIQVSDHWTSVEEQVGSSIQVLSSIIWQCK